MGIIRVPSTFVRKSASKRLKVGRRYKYGKSYVIKHRDNGISVTKIGKSLQADRRKKVGSNRIPRTSGGKLKRGYGHKGDY